jgi:predicted Zn-dependent protease
VETTNLISPAAVEMRNLALPPPSNDVVEYVRAATGVNENRIKEAVNILKNWVKLQPHLPHDYGKHPRR